MLIYALTHTRKERENVHGGEGGVKKRKKPRSLVSKKGGGSITHPDSARVREKQTEKKDFECGSISLRTRLYGD